MTLLKKIKTTLFVLWLPLLAMLIVFAWQTAYGKELYPHSIPFEICEQPNNR